VQVRHHILDSWFYSQADDSSEGPRDDEETLRAAVERYVEELRPQEPDTLAEILRASSIFDIYQISLYAQVTTQ
jgi:hypothetical protein